MSCFSGKAAVIIGGANGIGRATSLRFASEGVAVLVADIDRESIEQTLEMIRTGGGASIGAVTDVRDSESIAAAIALCNDRLGRLDFAVNCAGVEQNHELDSSITRREQTWDHVIGVNLRGLWLCMEHEIRHMLSHGGGAIVNMASVAGFRATPPQDIYASSKHGVVGVTRGAAVEYASQSIRINAVAPGIIQTPMLDRALALLPDDEAQEHRRALAAKHPMGRIGRATEVAAAALWLCSEDASFTTGHVLTVDGGWLAG